MKNMNTMLKDENYVSNDEKKFNSYLAEVKAKYSREFSDLSSEAELCYSVYMDGYSVHDAVIELELQAKENKKVVDINSGSTI